MTVSISVAPAWVTCRVSAAFISGKVAPSGKPTTEHTPTPEHDTTPKEKTGPDLEPNIRRLAAVAYGEASANYDDLTEMTAIANVIVRQVKERPKGFDEIDDPDKPGKEITCMSCHDPHSSDYKKLFPVANICAKCHKYL